MDPDQDRLLASHLTHDQGQMLFSRDLRPVAVDLELPVAGGQPRCRHLLHQGLMPEPIANEILHSDDEEVVLFRNPGEIREHTIPDRKLVLHRFHHPFS